MKFVAPNGETVEARDEFQASVFLKAGFKPVEDKPKRPTKNE